ncbi:MAG: hypothetical protein JXB13_19610 [Phycisphaerae bacterium]|nr:hypothetical protein [Phycisphaerae bacterium]
MLGLILSILMAAAPAANTEPERVDLEHGFYLIGHPAGVPVETPLPLVICLHGTETTAAGILAFWQSFEHTLPMVLVAPQATHAGWRDSDVKLMQEFFDHVSRTVSYDPNRVLLTGHSAGGAMAFHLLYVQGFPASAVAVTANYVPPTVQAEHVRAHNHVPVFYAVGESDINRDRMRDGLALLRGSDASITVQRPQIGHVLDPGVGQAAMAWFETLCRAWSERALTDARRCRPDEGCLGPVVCGLEAIVRHPTTQFPDQVNAAIELMAELQQEGRRGLLRSERLLEGGRPMEAREEALRVERRYAGSSLGNEARRHRQSIDALPEVQDLLRLKQSLAGQSPSAGSSPGNGTSP